MEARQKVHVDSQLKFRARKGTLGMVQVEDPQVLGQSISVVEAARAAVVLVVHGSFAFAYRGQARWTGGSPEHFAKAVAAAAAGAHDPVADY